MPQLVYQLLLVQELAQLVLIQLQDPHLVLSAQSINMVTLLVFKHQRAQGLVQQTPFRQLGVQLVPIVNAKLILIVTLDQPQEAAVTLVALHAQLDP